jgi:beta-galactosidase/beta-glucuronidase
MSRLALIVLALLALAGGASACGIPSGRPLWAEEALRRERGTYRFTPEQRAARLDADFAAMSQLGVNTLVGWDPAEFDETLMEHAAAHGLGVVLPFDLDPQADYTDPDYRAELSAQVMAWVDQYRAYPALRMWGLGNEVLHKIVHPVWVGAQDPARARQARAFSDWLVETADAIHAADPDHPVTYRSAEDAFAPWVVEALRRRGGGPRPWFVWGTNCYQNYLSDIVDEWPSVGMSSALWVSEFAPGGEAVPDRPDGFRRMWGYVRRHPDYVLGGAVYAWTRDGPEGVDRDFGLTDDGTPVDGRSLDAISELFHQD